MVRLVKGAYWDTEVKRAQERGLAGLSGVHPQGDDRPLLPGLRRASCSAARPRLYPQFATHNALTVASVIEEAGGVEGYEFQRLHGMGEALYEALLAEHPGRRLPRLCAGRRPSRPARLSGAAAAGERRQLLVRVGRGRSDGADRGDPEAAAGLDRRRQRMRATRASRCRAISTAGAAQLGGRRIRRPRQPRRAARRDRARVPNERRAADRRQRAGPRAVVSPIDGATIGT